MGGLERSHISMSLEGNPDPGALVLLRMRGKPGLLYSVFFGFSKSSKPEFLDPFGYLLVDVAFGQPPLVPLGFLPDDVPFRIPEDAPIGAELLLLPVCLDKGSSAGNFGAYLKVTIGARSPEAEWVKGE